MSNKFNDNHRDDELLRYAIMFSNPRTVKHVEKVIKLLWTKKLDDISDIELLAVDSVVNHFPLSFPLISKERLMYNIENRNIPDVKIINGRVKIRLNVHFECMKWLDS